MMMMMAIGFTVSGDVHQLRPSPAARKSAGQTLGKNLSVVQQLFEGYRLRNGTIIKKQRDCFAACAFELIGPAGIDFRSAHILPVSAR